MLEFTTRAHREDQHVQGVLRALHKAESDSRRPLQRRVCRQAAALLQHHARVQDTQVWLSVSHCFRRVLKVVSNLNREHTHTQHKSKKLIF